jgi:hypothetical protein
MKKISFISVLDVATKIVAIAAIPTFIYQQYSVSRNAQMEKSFELVKKFRGEVLYSSQSDLISQWDKRANEIGYINKQGLSSADLDNLVRSIVHSTTLANGKPMSAAVYNMTDFLEYVLACGRFAHCDKAALSEYFMDYAKQFYCLYGVVIRDRQTELSIKSYGAELKRFVEENGGC